MRPKNRIDLFTNELNRVWKEYFQDWRFGQLMNNFFNWIFTEKKIDIFFIEEKEMLKYLYEFCGESEESDNEK